LQPLADFCELHLQSAATLSLSLAAMDDTGRFGRVETTADKMVTSFAEKISGQRGWINAGMYALHKEKMQQSFLVEACSLENDILPQLLQRKALYGYQAAGYFTDIGIPEAYLAAQTELPQWMHR
jgi:NDP-sugar pyrophosphorylase family protein